MLRFRRDQIEIDSVTLVSIITVVDYSKDGLASCIDRSATMLVIVVKIRLRCLRTPSITRPGFRTEVKTYDHRFVIKSFGVNYPAGLSIRSQRLKEKNRVYYGTRKKVTRNLKTIWGTSGGSGGRGPCPVSAQRRSGASDPGSAVTKGRRDYGRKEFTSVFPDVRS